MTSIHSGAEQEPLQIPGKANQKEFVSIHELLQILLQKKLLILSSVVLTTTLAIVVTFLKPVVYRAEVPITAPDDIHLFLELNGLLQKSNVSNILQFFPDSSVSIMKELEITPEKVFLRLVKNINLESHKQKFFAEKYPSIKFDTIKDSISSFYGKDPNSSFVLTITGEQPNQISDLVNEYASFVVNDTVSQVIMETREISIKFNDAKINDIEKQISLRGAKAKMMLQNYINLLREALVIANRLKIVENNSTGIHIIPATSLMNNGETGVYPGDYYLRGSKALEEEIKVLDARNSTPIFVENLEAGKVYLKNINEQIKEVSNLLILKGIVANEMIEKRTQVPPFPVGNNHKKTVALGLFLGLILGVLLAVLLHFSGVFFKENRVSQA